MESEESPRKTLWQLLIYRKLIGEKYEEIIHWIWVLNKISEILHCTEATKNYINLKKTVSQSKKCQRWKFLAQIRKVEKVATLIFNSQNGELSSGSRRLSLSAVYWKKTVEMKSYWEGHAEKLHRVLLECHKTIKTMKKRGFQEMRRGSKDKGFVHIEEETSSLYAKEVEVSTELLQLVDDLKLDTSGTRDDHECVLCASYYVPEEGLQTTPVDLNGKKVQRKGVQFSDDFQGSVRERLKEQFPSLLDGVFSSPNVMKSNSRKNSRQTSMRNNAKGSLTVQQNIEDVGDNQQDEDVMNEEHVRNTLADVSLKKQVPSGAKGSSFCGGTDTNIACELLEGRQPVNEIEIKVASTHKVAQAFIDFANDNSFKPVVILAEYKYENFLRYVKRPAGPNGYITKQKGDIDLMVIIPQMGIFLGQLKDIKDDSSNLKRYISEASRQCRKDKSVFSEYFRDKIAMFDLPIFEFIPLTLVSRKKLDKCCNFTQCHLYNIILTKDDVEDEACFKAWLQKRQGGAMNVTDNWIIKEEHYWTLAERFVGCGSEIIIDPYQKIIGDHCFQSPLTDEQMNLVNDMNKCFQYLILAGYYKTGKSLTVVKKSLKLAKNIKSQKGRNGKVFIIACSDIHVDGESLDLQFPDHTVHHLQQLCKGQYEDIISVEKFSSFTQTESTDLSGSKGVDLFLEAILQKRRDGYELHLMFDGIPAKFVKKLQNHQQKFAEYLKFLETVWFVIGTNSYRVWCDGSATLRIEDCKPCPDFQYVHLNKVLRSPKVIFDLSQNILKCSVDDHKGSLINSYKGSQPLLFRVPSCGCSVETHINRASGQVELNPLKYSCMQERLSSTLRAIFCEIGILKGDKIAGKWPGKVTMLVLGVENESLFRDLHTLLIKCFEDFKGLNYRDTLSDGCLSDLRHLLAEESECSGVTREENHVKREDPIQDYQAVGAVGGYDDASISHEVISKERKGMTGSVQVKQNSGDDTKMDVDSGSGRPQILLTRATYFAGCESHVVICIDLNAMRPTFKNNKVTCSTLPVSRCLSQYVHLTWHDEEAEVMFQMNLNASHEDLDGSKQRNMAEAKVQILEKLLEEGVIKEKEVYVDRDYSKCSLEGKLNHGSGDVLVEKYSQRMG